MNAPIHLSELRQQQTQPAQRAPSDDDYGVDFYTARGLKLAYRLAEALSTADVPTMFRARTVKTAGYGVNRTETVVENPAAIGNCLVAIETARSVGMSIVAVMQHANVIEGKLSWSGQFVIAAINASRRFTPLRFDVRDRGQITAKYSEKTSWNKEEGRYNKVEKTVQTNDFVCIAWALPYGFTMPANVVTLEQAKKAGLPVIEGAPVSMKMAIEEGWYAKDGSKWQGEMRHLMAQYRAGAFFGRIHAPDVVMGMGRTTEEHQDMVTVDVAPDGRVNNVSLDTVSRTAPTPQAEVVQPPAAAPAAPAAAPATTAAEPPAPTPAPAPAAAPAAPTFDAEAFAERMRKCLMVDSLDVLADEIRFLTDEAMRKSLVQVYERRREELLQTPASQGRHAPSPAPAPAAAPASRTARRTSSTGNFGGVDQ